MIGRVWFPKHEPRGRQPKRGTRRDRKVPAAVCFLMMAGVTFSWESGTLRTDHEDRLHLQLTGYRGNHALACPTVSIRIVGTAHDRVFGRVVE